MVPFFLLSEERFERIIHHRDTVQVGRFRKFLQSLFHVCIVVMDRGVLPKVIRQFLRKVPLELVLLSDDFT
jgi:hypothetical protein